MNREHISIKPCPDGIAAHGVVHVDNPPADWLNLPRGSLLRLDRRRRPRNGYRFLVDFGSRSTRTVRRYTLANGVVSLSRGDGHVTALDRS